MSDDEVALPSDFEVEKLDECSRDDQDSVHSLSDKVKYLLVLNINSFVLNGWTNFILHLQNTEN